MTTTYDPTHAAYVDEADVRLELARVFDVCQGCRRCTDLCGTFPTLFELVEAAGGDAERMTPAEQDDVVSTCVHCRRCVVDCPYAQGVDDRSAVDVPRLVLRAAAMRRANGQVAVRDRWQVALLGRTDLIGKVATRSPRLLDRAFRAAPGSLVRRWLARTTGVSSERALPTFTTETFSRWFASRPRIRMVDARRAVTVVPTCVVEYQTPEIGRDLVRVYERNGIECSVSAAGCCGAPSLFAGDVQRFRRIARRNVAALAAEIRSGKDVVVPNPACAHVLRNESRHHVGGTDADLVAGRTYDAAEYLMRLHRSDDEVLDTDFDAARIGTIVYDSSRVVDADTATIPARDLLRLTGADVVVARTVGAADTPWELRRHHDAAAAAALDALAGVIDANGAAVVATDGALSAAAIADRTGATVLHPLQILARAYGNSAES